jgi:hypothetical protein
MPFEELAQARIVESTRWLRPAWHDFVFAESEGLAGGFRLEVRQALVVRIHESGCEIIAKLRNSQKRRDTRVPVLHGHGFARAWSRQDFLVGRIKLAQVVELRPKPHGSGERFTELDLLASQNASVRARPSNNAGNMSRVALGRAPILRAVGERDRLNFVG